MAFLAPLTLLGLSLVALPVVVHLLVRRRGRSLDFPSLRFLRETPSFQLRPRRIRQPLLLLLRVLALILVVAGLARPLLTYRSQKPEVVRFIMLDASLSMRAGGRAEAAREQARAIVNKLAGGERACVIALTGDALVLAETTSERERLLEAINGYEPAGGAANYGAGLDEISRRLEREPLVIAQADIISDFQQSGLDERNVTGAAAHVSRPGARLRIATYPVGSAVERNAFFVDEALARNKRGAELSASEIISSEGGRTGARQVWEVSETEGARPGVEWRTESNGQVTGRMKVLGPDDFDADDERYFAFAPPTESRVLLIEDETSATTYLRAALEAAASRGESAWFALDRRRGLPETSRDLAAYSLVVVTLHGAADERFAHALSEYARSGGTVWLFLGRDLDASSWNKLAGTNAASALPFESVTRSSVDGPLTFGAADASSPQLRGMDESALDALGAVRARESYVVTPRAGADTLIRLINHESAFVSERVGEGRILLVSTSLERASSELGLSPAFPALTTSVLSATQGMREPPLSQTIGEAVRLDVPPETEVKITDEKGRERAATTARELVRRPLAHVSEPGIYRMEFAGRQMFMAFNAPVSESERALATDQDVKLRFPALEAAGARAALSPNSLDAMERASSTWRYLLCAALIFVLAELWMSMRERNAAEG